jgi:hypothetical protein
MKMIVLGIVVAIGLAVVAGLALQSSNQSAATRFQTENVRL